MTFFENQVLVKQASVLGQSTFLYPKIIWIKFRSHLLIFLHFEITNPSTRGLANIILFTNLGPLMGNQIITYTIMFINIYTHVQEKKSWTIELKQTCVSIYTYIHVLLDLVKKIGCTYFCVDRICLLAVRRHL